MADFYVVATPIGNLEDVTFRAIGILSSVDVILCEDTRVTMRLLQRYNINTPLLSYHARSGAAKTTAILSLIKSGKTLALVSDAGTPTISDPGSELVSAIRGTFPDMKIVPIAGASAVAAALSASGLPSSDFLFLGFLPHKKGRETLFKEITASKRTVVFYESVHRAIKTLTRLSELLSDKRKVVVARELTKVFEELVVGSATEVLAKFTAHPDTVKGEFVIMVGSEK
ncbi:MAG: 16S rRNA (cytidine(1402)-2'-O)-methyltransferase [Candidatus Taylorbacteria bacterium RIFCSPHIGHO2_01_FULL_46_22b]|uniref:Ribosomal RNA small subunit methyltransferase I n=1 Tax=Candidatus Taylorbacteria bacterium RIFCSPHIGHO2_01_FULL_46_22b TaxID=1802301 RepID=A0A1G2M3W0_9BACT|nr:MAG: 16S rRNA (cytidine(1402)-2'-O)-methyltransferase [Candidatus Taylorbacteria bacterium RIFCSPHIGHO2_01_FULL_46_22b]